MITINDISIGSKIWFDGKYYIVTSIETNTFVARCFNDGIDRTFTESYFKRIFAERHFADTIFVAVNIDGSPSIYLQKPVKDIDDGDWHCYEDNGICYIDRAIPISWNLMQKLTGKDFMTYADEPIEIK